MLYINVGYHFSINDEIEHLEQQQSVSIPFGATVEWLRAEDARKVALKNDWETLYDKITHSKNTALFAFIRYDPQRPNELTESDVQNVLWFIIGWVPLLFTGPRAGQVEVGCNVPDRWTMLYQYSSGACYPARSKMTAEGKVLMMMIDFHKIVVRDGVDPQAAHHQFLKIDEYRQLYQTKIA